MSRRRFGPAMGALMIALASACATGGDGALEALDGGASNDGSGGDTASHLDSSSSHDSSPGVDATTGVDAGIDSTTGNDSGGVDATATDAGGDSTASDASTDSSADSSADSASDSGVDSGGTCMQTCTMGCCDTNGVCHLTFTDQYCPTTNMPAGACENCASQGLFCFLDIFIWLCI